MALSAAGDQRAFRELVDSNNPWMIAELTWKLGGNVEEAKDRSQEIWIKIWNNLVNHHYKEKGKGEWWMERILYNDVKSFFRHCKKQVTTVQMTEELQEVLEETYGALDKGEQEFEVMQGLEAAEKYMKDLLVRIVNYHLIDDMSNKEIARKQHRSLDKVKEDYKEGMKQLRENLVKLDSVPIHH
jgi:RNA polymerase sigma factor (sigma-70 family)